MITLDGMFLFKLTILRTLYELFIQKHLSTELQSSELDKYYQRVWIETCTKIIKNSNVASVIELIDFSTFLFKKFSQCTKRTFKNDKIKPQIFGYSIKNDEDLGFSRKRMRKFLYNNEAVVFNGTYINKFIHEIIELMDHVDFISSQSTEKNIVIVITKWKQFKTIFESIAIQYEFINAFDSCLKFFVYSKINENTNLLEYEILSK